MITTIIISTLASAVFFTLAWTICSKRKIKLIIPLEQQIKKSEDKIKSLKEEHENVLQQIKYQQSQIQLSKRDNLNNAFLKNGQNVEKISQQLKEAQAVIEQTFSLIPDIYKSSQQTIITTQQGKKEIDTLSHSVDSWASSIDSLQNIQGLIDEIFEKANQIRDVSAEANLLALNASIEAARAGEHGRGFAVVATSMRELSNKSAEATVEINSTVDMARSEVTSIIDGISASVHLLTDVTTDVNKSFIKIEDEVNNIDSISEKSMSEADISKIKFQSINSEVNNQLESITRLLADTLGEVTGIKIKDVSVSADFSGMKIIDVRRPDEFNGELGHIPNAELMCLQDNFEQQLKRLDKSSPYLFVCRSGGRSARAARIALGVGFEKIYNMKGGMLDYRRVHK